MLITFKNYLYILGALLVIGGGMSPMLKIPLLGNWNYWEIDFVLAAVVFALTVIGLFGTVLKKISLVRYTGWGILLLLIFTLIAVYFKVNSYFGFVPLNKLARIAGNMVHYQWIGWILIFCGSLIMIISPREPIADN